MRESQTILSATAKALVNIVGMGRLQPQGSFNNAGSKAEDVPTMRVLPKVHKDVEPEGHPKSRPVVAVSTGISSRAGDVIANILNPMVQLDLPSMEEQSTEQVLDQLQEAEELIRELGHTNTMVSSLDVKALYPSLNHEEAAESVCRFIRRIRTKLTGVNWRLALVFLASNLSQVRLKEEGLHKVVPRRLKRKGPCPGSTTPELSTKVKMNIDDKGGGEDVDQQDTKWRSTDLLRLSEEDKRLIVGKVVKIAIMNAFCNHIYQFAGQSFRQLLGGPIGLYLTSLVARIVMDEWATVFLDKVDKAGVIIHAMVK